MIYICLKDSTDKKFQVNDLIDASFQTLKNDESDIDYNIITIYNYVTTYEITIPIEEFQEALRNEKFMKCENLYCTVPFTYMGVKFEMLKKYYLFFYHRNGKSTILSLNREKKFDTCVELFLPNYFIKNNFTHEKQLRQFKVKLLLQGQ